MEGPLKKRVPTDTHAFPEHNRMAYSCRLRLSIVHVCALGLLSLSIKNIKDERKCTGRVQIQLGNFGERMQFALLETGLLIIAEAKNQIILSRFLHIYIFIYSSLLDPTFCALVSF